MNIYNFVVLFFAFGAFLLGVLIYLKRQDKLGVCYFAFSTSAAIWGAAYSFMVSEGVTYANALLMARLGNMAAIFIPILWFHIAIILSERPRKKILLTFYAIAILIDAFGFTDWFIPEVKPIGDFKYYTQGAWIFIIYNIVFVLATILGFHELILKLNKSSKEEKIQFIGLMSATLAGFTAGMPTFLPCYGINFPQYGLFLMPIYPFCMAYFMMRKDLFSMTKFVEAVHKDKLAAIGTLATSINHEVRNPLYVIRGIAETQLEKENLDLAKISEAFTRTKQQAERALDIMRRFAIFAKQNTHVIPEFKSVEIYSLLENILPLIQHELDLDKIELITKISKDLFVEADERHLEEILFNLIVNGCQALKSNGGGIIEIAAQRVGKNVQISVTDNGPGIPEAIQHQIFEPFYTTKDEGTGLGLYITKQLVERNRGTIEVNAEKDKTTSFILLFPRDGKS